MEALGSSCSTRLVQEGAPLQVGPPHSPAVSSHHSICLSATPAYVQYAHAIHVYVQYLFAAYTGLAIFFFYFLKYFLVFLLLLEHSGIIKQILFYYNVFIT